MRLYHYTRRENVDGIRQLGLVARPGAFAELIDGQLAAVWLTTSEDWSLAEQTQPGRATARVVLELSVAETHLWQWSRLGPQLCAMAGGDLHQLSRYNLERPGYVEWWCYLRNIAPQRVGDVEHR